MAFDRAQHQKPGQPGRAGEDRGEAPFHQVRDEARPACRQPQSPGRTGLMEQALSRENIALAWKHVKANKGARTAGVDGLSVEQTLEYLKTHKARIRAELLSGDYRPQAVRRVEIPKPTGGTRELGIPTIVDRLIQQALLQVLQPLIDPTFSEFSYGFRPGRRAHDAVKQAHRYVQEGYRFVVDIDLEKFFDRVNHDILMDRLAKHIGDKAVLRLIRRYLQAGIMMNGVVMERTEGTPQGSPLSPLLANVMLDEVDRILQQRKHRFARYADDLNVYVRSQRAGERVLRSMRAIYEKLHLRVNETKTVVGPAFGRKFLGYCFRRWSGGAVKIAVAPQALHTYKQRIRGITRRAGGRSMEQVAERLRNYMPGWKTYFQLAQTPATFKNLDSWLRRRLRAIQLKHWKRGTTIYRSLRRLGATHELAASVAMTRKRWWHSSRSDVHQILTAAHFDRLGVPRLA